MMMRMPGGDDDDDNDSVDVCSLEQIRDFCYT